MQREQSSQNQRTLVRLLGLSVPGYLNITLASNQNNTGTATGTQGSVDPGGSTNLYPISDTDKTGVVDSTSTTQFVSDANSVLATSIAPKQLDRIVYDSSSDMTNMSLKEFLAKPVIVQSGKFTDADTFSSFNPIYNPSSSFLANAMLTNKFEGFLGFRATTVYRLVVNATRFQQGRYNMSYIASGGADTKALGFQQWYKDHAATLVQRTTLPHVELDLCCDTEAIIKIPYHSVVNFFPQGSLTGTVAFGDLGVLLLYPYEKLAAVTGALECSYTIYSYFEDIVLVNAALPQSGRLFTSKKKKSDTEVEQDSVGIGPISSSLIKVRDAANIFAKVPFLSSYASSVSWFSDIGASAAKVFGWSKPVSLAPSTRVTQNFLPYAANTDGPDMSFPLSYSYENSVGVGAGFAGTDVDEMDFGFLATIPVWNSTTTWATGVTAGTSIFITEVATSFDVYNTIVNTSTINHYTPLQFIASHFLYWRGSIVYKLKFVKTEFHSGRLSVTFNPMNAAYNFAPGITLQNSSYLHRQIIDIRETNEFTFVVPFVSDSPYRKNVANAEGLTGYFEILVLDPLVAPATVSSSIKLIVEMAAGPDIEFAVPQQNVYSYIAGITPQSGVIDQGSNVCSNLESAIGSSIIKPDGSVNALHCIGEKITSFRALLKLPQQNLFLTTPTITN